MSRTLIRLVILIGIIWLLGMSGSLLAFSPDSSYSQTADFCARCHRAHTGTAKSLLKDSSTSMCFNCHRDGQGADTDVANGVYVDSGDSIWGGNTHTWGVDSEILLGGGFENVGGPSAVAVSSNHDLGSTNMPHGSSSGIMIQLECISCHSGHLSLDFPDQYRVLRTLPGDTVSDIAVNWNGPWEGESQLIPKGGEYRAYTEHDFDVVTIGTQHYSMNYKDNISLWCSGCHTRYLADDAHPQYKVDPGYDAGDASGNVPRHRHSVAIPITGRYQPEKDQIYDFDTDLPLEDRTGDGRTDDDLLSCITCHRAHGTDMTMQGWAALPASDRGSLPHGSDSTLLRKSNRGVCVTCHKMNNAY